MIFSGHQSMVSMVTLLQLTTTNSSSSKPLHPFPIITADFLPTVPVPQMSTLTKPTFTRPHFLQTTFCSDQHWEHQSRYFERWRQRFPESVDDSYSGRCQYWDAKNEWFEYVWILNGIFVVCFFLACFWSFFFGDHWKTCRVLFALTGVTLRGWRVWKPRFQAIQNTPVSWGRNRYKE